MMTIQYMPSNVYACPYNVLTLAGIDFTDKEINSLFEFKDFYTMQIFAEFACVKFYECKFKNRKEFREYFKK